MSVQPAAGLLPGDRWGNSSESVFVDKVEHLGPDEYYPRGRVRVTGRLCGRKDGVPHGKQYRWSFHPDQALDVERRLEWPATEQPRHSD